MKDKLKNILKMARKQMPSLICAAVALLGIVLSYWPTQGWFSELGEKVQASIGVGGQLDQLIKKERHLPSTSLDSNSSVLLPFYPTDDAIRVGADAMTQVHNQSVSVLESAARINKHVPLAPGVLPAGGDIAGETFRREYRKAITDDSRIMNWPAPEAANAASAPIPPLVAGRTITDEEIAAAIAEATKEIQARYQDATGNVPGELKDQADAETAKAATIMPLQKAYEAAEKIKVYLQPGVIKVPAAAANINGAVGGISPDDIWTAQLWLWIDEDMATAVARTNADAKNVMDSPIKQITDFTIKEPAYAIFGDPAAGKEDAALTAAPDDTPTGRVCNGMYDVVQFNLGLDVDGRRVPEILDSLQRNQFMTVLCVQSTAVDSSAKATTHFIYGNAPIVHLDLAMEELLLHSWTSAIEPATAGVAKFTANPAAAGGMGGPMAAPTSFIFPITTHAAGS